MKPQIVNIINFLRAYCPFFPGRDVFVPFDEQVKLMKKHSLKGTFLFAYDTLVDDRYITLAKSLDTKQFELGVWFEFSKPHIEAVGLPWTSEYDWDHFANVGFSVGYDKETKEKLIDEHFRKFNEIFGYYPCVFGSWVFDSHVVRYIKENYNVDAMCICRDQYGTDGYTFWGGYYGQGYYPSKNNMYVPAASKETQIDIPIFRMLGSDQVYQYDSGLDLSDGTDGWQTVVTLEPYCSPENQNYYVTGGGVPEWVDWFLKENYNGECLSFGYAQAGQENYLGWEGMEKGLKYQFKRFEELKNEGKLIVETLGDTGRRYKADYDMTPASTITAHSAYDDDNKTSVWYSSKNYRVNLYTNDGVMKIRDIHVFDDNQPDPYEDNILTHRACSYETLPVVDGYRYSGDGVLSGLYLRDLNDNPLKVSDYTFSDCNDVEEGMAMVDYESVNVALRQNSIRICSKDDFKLIHLVGESACKKPEIVSLGEKCITLKYLDRVYSVKLLCGRFEDAFTIVSEKGVVEAAFVL